MGNLRTVAKNVIAVCLILAAVYTFVECENAVDAAKARAASMSTSARVIASIASVGGKTMEEAYYSAYGSYLSSEAFGTADSATIAARGVELLSMLSLLAGLYILLVVRIEPIAAPPVVEESLPAL